MYNMKSQANFLISVEILDSLKVTVPPRARSQFVEKAIEKALKKTQFIKALEDSSGAWKNEDYSFNTEEFIRSLRENNR